MGDQYPIKRDKNEIWADLPTVVAVSSAARLIPLVWVGIFSH
jgi:hypothetical protein